MFLRESYRKFAEYTSVEGFGQMQRASHPAEALFWLLAIVAGVFLTVYDCITPIRGYLNEASVSTISVVYNDTVQFRGAGFCVQVDTTELLIRNFSALQDDAMLTSFIDCLKSAACTKGGMFFDTYSDQIFALAKILSRYTILENAVNRQVERSREHVDGIPNAFYERVLLKSGNLTSHLWKLIGEVLCTRMNTTERYWAKNNATSYDVCSLAQLVWFGVPPSAADETDLLCYNIEEFMKFRTMDEQYELSFYPRNVLSARRDFANHFAYISVDIEPIITDGTSNYAPIAFDHCLQIEFDPMTRITLLSKHSRPCSQQPYLECNGRCAVREIAELTCKCASVSWQPYIADEIADQTIVNRSCLAVYGNPRNYESCSRSAPKNRRRCHDQCIRSCEKNIFNLVHSDCQGEYPANATMIVYRLYRRFYSHIEEQLVYDLSMLVSSIGGIVGLWLGAGFFGILEALLFVPKTVAEHIIRRAPKSASQLEKRLLHLETSMADRFRRLEELIPEMKSERNVAMSGDMLPFLVESHPS